MAANESSYKDSRDGHVYKTVFIGKQEWFAENLCFETLDECYSYDQTDPGIRDEIDEQEVVGGYGYLYTIEAAKEAVPDGWRLPSEKDFIQLTRTVGVPKIQTIKFLSKYLKDSLFNCDKRRDNGVKCNRIQSPCWNDDFKDPFGFSALYSGYGSLFASEKDGFREEFLKFKGRGGYEEEDMHIEARLWMSSERNGKPAYFFIEEDRVGFCEKFDRSYKKIFSGVPGMNFVNKMEALVESGRCLCSVRLVRDMKYSSRIEKP